MSESSPGSAALLRHASATVHGRFLVRPPAPAGESAPWLIGFHGQAQSADVMLQPFADAAPGPEWLVASVQALHPFPAKRTGEIVANWMTRQDRELAIASNIAYVNNVLASLAREFGAPRLIAFAGFSQGVAMVYRAALCGAHAAHAVIAGCGDVPPEFTATPSAATQPWPRVLAATGESDEWYTPQRLAHDAEFLRTVAPEARTLVFEGGHEWNAALCAEARAFLSELAPR